MNTLTQYDMLNRYLQAVRKYMPFGQSAHRQEDILRELSANIASQMEDEEAEEGRPLTGEEQAAILKRNGHPMQVAGRYLPQQYLIGPAMFPAYLYTLKLAFFLMLLVYTVTNVVLFIVHPTTLAQAFGAVFNLPGIVLTMFAWITLVYAILDFYAVGHRERSHFFEHWNPQALPKFQPSRQWGKPRSTFLELMPGVLGVLWWLLLPQNPWMVLGPGAAFLKYAPQMRAIYPTILVLMLLQLLLDGAGAIHAQEPWQKRAKGVAAKFIALMSFYVWIRAGVYVTVRPPLTGDHYLQLAQISNTGVLMALKVAAAVTAVLFLIELGRLLWDSWGKRTDG